MIGQSGSQSDVMMDEVDGPDLSALRKAEMDKLHMKMQKTMERIKAEQREKEGEWGRVGEVGGEGMEGRVGEVGGEGMEGRSRGSMWVTENKC